MYIYKQNIFVEFCDKEKEVFINQKESVFKFTNMIFFSEWIEYLKFVHLCLNHSCILK